MAYLRTLLLHSLLLSPLACGDKPGGDDGDDGTTAVGSSEGGSSTGAPVCDLDAAACELAASNGAYEDCGTVDPTDDDAAAWQAAHDCAITAAKEQRAFKVIFWLQGIDSEVGLAYASILGESYGITQFSFDSDPCGGGGCGPVISASSCQGLVAVPDCTVEPGNPCLTCADPGPSPQVCGPE